MTTMLDAGADGIVLADVRDPVTARAAAERMLHPPDGTRGWGPRRLTLRRRRHSQGLPAASLCVQIESSEAVENAAEIAAVPGVDAIVVGTADLSFSLGQPLEVGAPAMLEALREVRQAARAAGVEFGVAGPIDRLPPEALVGAGQLIHSTDARICATAVDRVAEELRTAMSREDDRS
jgi:4-hydroxy-2-oxoheptanedioate aldolase